MGGAVAPAVHVYAGNAVERSDGALQADRHDAELRGEEVRKIPEVEVRSALEDQDHRQAGGTVHRPDSPSLIAPDVRVVGGATGDAVGGVSTAAGWLDVDRSGQRLDPHIALEREGRPAREVGQGHGVVGHDVTLAQARRYCPESIFREPGDRWSAVRGTRPTFTHITV